MLTRLFRVIRGVWNYTILGRRPVMAARLADIDHEFADAIRQWTTELNGSQVPAREIQTEPVYAPRYVWKKTTWLVMPEWQLLDIEEGRYVGRVWKYGRKEFKGNGSCYISRRRAMDSVEASLGLKSVLQQERR